MRGASAFAGPNNKTRACLGVLLSTAMPCNTMQHHATPSVFSTPTLFTRLLTLNPETLADPNNKTRACLDVLLETVFVNTVRGGPGAVAWKLLRSCLEAA
jgi:hypothetical protein